MIERDFCKKMANGKRFNIPNVACDVPMRAHPALAAAFVCFIVDSHMVFVCLVYAANL